MGVAEPEQAQKPNKNNLAENRVAVDQEGNRTTNKGGLDQIQNRHNTKLNCTVGLRQLPARAAKKAVVRPSATLALLYVWTGLMPSGNCLSRPDSCPPTLTFASPT